MNFRKKRSVKANSTNSKNNVNVAEVFQLILLLVPVYKLAKKILNDRKMK